MIFKSIRWRLQLWYGLMLVTVLAGFGVTAYQLERAQRLHGIDEELQKKMTILSRALELNHPGGGGPDQGFRRPPPPPPDDAPPDGPPEDRMRPDHPPPGQFKVPADLTGYYYFVWQRDGTLMGMSTNAPPHPPLQFASPQQWPTNASPGSFFDKSRIISNLSLPKSAGLPPDSFHELKLITPPGEVLIVGRSIAPELDELHKFGYWLAGVGSVVLLLALAVGWWLVGRAIRPIDDISATAVKIAAGDLAQRIDLEDTENELGRLASVLNSTFARLEAAFAQQGQFTADAAHELRTPVSVILTQTQTALKRERDAADYRATLEACERSAQKMRRLLESLLELARLDAGQETMRLRPINLADTVRDCVELLQPLAQERQITIRSELPALELAGDPERLAQVFTNLLTNAIHYNKDGGEVRVTLEQQNDAAIVTVTDTGVGISAEDLPRIFERFYRADKSRSGAAGRNGLGLAISRAVVEAHGGAIEVSSEPGVGTIFTVRLPVVRVK
jgi:signal transduction histidine kinase